MTPFAPALLPTAPTRRAGGEASLLDRLTDRSAERKGAPEVDPSAPSRLRDALLRDLSWLLNTANLEADIDFDAYPHARRSVVNFGISALAGMRMSEVEWDDIERTIRAAIVDFEPRICAGSLQVRCLSESGARAIGNVLSLLIQGDVISPDRATAFSFRSEIDLESGHISLRAQRAE
ncbi:type VI secretion system baseplate subunit TssE [Lysobacter sp. BMK333-48F3]|uniref:type VI secretion system baseplate subunit TssE n=1 Tax=Lysobacter sp. BMK333-48F3 TaxID=2867962 RepID=UPI001C8C4CB0|nr:type VI secretion system baseplate subunit TssE [Lysobacter sp. BMK333-48F3]MBX9403042.1 type VI secretion system baseplate subunit TssE [Lysobacter sp. BMK333-48F3]